MKKILSIVFSFMLVLPVGLLAQDDPAMPEQGGPEKKIEGQREVKKDKKHYRKAKKHAKKRAIKKKHHPKKHNPKKHHPKKHKGVNREQPVKTEVNENAEDIK